MDAWPRLSRFGSALKKRAARIEKWAVLQSDRGLQWLYARCEPVNWKTIRAKVSTTLRLSTNTSGLFASAAIFVVLAIFIPVAWRWYSYELFNNNTASYPHANLVNPVVAAVGAALLIGAAIWQARTATKQAEIAAQRHFAQTEADRQRRITESFSKAIEQLGNDKLEVRLGGIYALERISKESPDDYWTVMENLTAFVWERSHRNEIERTSEGFEQRVSRRAYFLWQEAGQPNGRDKEFWAKAETGEPPATDIATVLTVFGRRSEQNRKREGTPLNLSGAILKWANLTSAHLERTNLRDAHLEGADLKGAHLEGADLKGAHLDGADLKGTHLEGAYLLGAHLEGADLRGAHFAEGAIFEEAHLEGANLTDTRLYRAYLSDAHLEGANLSMAHLQGAELFGAHLEGANLSETFLNGAWLDGTHLEGANLTATRLDGACSRRRISRTRISDTPGSLGRISTGPTSSARISNMPTSRTRISNGPTSEAQISEGPTF